MAAVDDQLSNLDELVDATADDLFYIVQVASGTKTGKRISPLNMKRLLLGVELPLPTVQITYVTAINTIVAGTNIDISASAADYTIATENGGAGLGASQTEFEDMDRLVLNKSDDDDTTEDVEPIIDNTTDATYVSNTVLSLAADLPAGWVLSICEIVT